MRCVMGQSYFFLANVKTSKWKLKNEEQKNFLPGGYATGGVDATKKQKKSNWNFFLLRNAAAITKTGEKNEREREYNCYNFGMS